MTLRSRSVGHELVGEAHDGGGAWDGAVPWVVATPASVVAVVVGSWPVRGAGRRGGGRRRGGAARSSGWPAARKPERPPRTEDPAARSGPKTDGVDGEVDRGALRALDEAGQARVGPDGSLQAARAGRLLREKRPTTGSRVTGMRVATWIGSNSLREFQARKVRVIADRAGAPCCTTSTEIGSTAKASAERSSAAGTTTVNGASRPAGTVGEAGLGDRCGPSSACVPTPSRRVPRAGSP